MQNESLGSTPPSSQPSKPPPPPRFATPAVVQADAHTHETEPSANAQSNPTQPRLRNRSSKAWNGSRSVQMAKGGGVEGSTKVFCPHAQLKAMEIPQQRRASWWTMRRSPIDCVWLAHFLPLHRGDPRLCGRGAHLVSFGQILLGFIQGKFMLYVVDVSDTRHTKRS